MPDGEGRVGGGVLLAKATLCLSTRFLKIEDSGKEPFTPHRA